MGWHHCVIPFEHTYKVDWDACMFSDECLSDLDLPLLVLPECTFRQDGLVVSNAHWVDIETVVHHFIPPTVCTDNPKVDTANNEADQSSGMPLWAQFPWLVASWEKLGHDPAPRVSRQRLGACQRFLPTSTLLLRGLTVEEVMSQLEVRRAQLAGSASKSAENYRMSVRGGNWTAANWGVVADLVRSEASDTASERFCNEHFLQKTATFNLQGMAKSPQKFWPLLGRTDCSTGSTCTWEGMPRAA